MRGALRRGGVGALIAATLALAGCGQKGPLYLPEKGGTVVTAPATAPPAPPAPGQPAQPSAVPQPQSSGEPSPPAETPAAPKKSDKDEDQQSPH